MAIHNGCIFETETRSWYIVKVVIVKIIDDEDTVTIGIYGYII